MGASALQSSLRSLRSLRSILCSFRFDRDFIAAVSFSESNFHAMIARHLRQLQSDEVRLDRQLAAAAIHKHEQADRAGSAEIRQGIHRRANGSTCKQYVIDKEQGDRIERD